MNIPEAILGGLVLVIFTAGTVWAVIQRIQKDLNGMGAKFGKFKDHDTRLVITMLVLAEKRSDREQIARNLMEW
jgi:hypothetical protein